MHVLYPPLKPNAVHQVKVDQQHTLYVEESGSPDGLPVIYLHGGPGLGVDENSRRYFDPEKYRIICFDQRGSGQSKPYCSLENNTTEHLIADIEAIRTELNVDRWILFGGSWGSTLSLAYAQAHPKRVKGMILRGIFLGRQQDIDWYFGHGVRSVYPDYWDEFVSILPPEERDDVVSAYQNRLSGSDEVARMNAAKHWGLHAARVATLRPNHDVEEELTNVHHALSMASIECHYFSNRFFLKENQLLDNMAVIKNIPGIIVHGRYDMVCPFENAWTLYQNWPEADLRIVRDAGHSALEAGITDALVKATDEMAHNLRRA
ncbi:prolyl aminopeptidase [Spongorhabdus nitratireducens]